MAFAELISDSRMTPAQKRTRPSSIPCPTDIAIGFLSRKRSTCLIVPFTEARANYSGVVGLQEDHSWDLDEEASPMVVYEAFGPKRKYRAAKEMPLELCRLSFMVRSVEHAVVEDVTFSLAKEDGVFTRPDGGWHWSADHHGPAFSTPVVAWRASYRSNWGVGSLTARCLIMRGQFIRGNPLIVARDI